MYRLTTALLAILLALPAHAAFSHTIWNDLLQRFVVPTDDGLNTRVDYANLKKHHIRVKAYQHALADVEREQFNAWPDSEKLAFLINAHNAAVVDMVLARYPDIRAFNELGLLARSPLKKKTIDLLGTRYSLLELRARIRGEEFREPRVYFALTQASLHGPGLRNEAYVGRRLASQLDDDVRLYLSDRSRNYLRAGTLFLAADLRELAPYLERGWQGFYTVQQFLARYADPLSVRNEDLVVLRRGDYRVEYLEAPDDDQLNSFHRSAVSGAAEALHAGR